MEDQVLTFSKLIMQSSIWESIGLFIIVYFIIQSVKTVATNVFQYALMKTELFGIGTQVDYNGKRAQIREIKFRWIILKVPSTGEIIYVRSSEWNKLILVVSGSKIESKE